jgi:hypothetical protein
MHRRRIVQRSSQVVVGLLAHLLAVEPIPSVRIGGDDLLHRLRSLTEEEPMPPRRREAHVRARERLPDQHAVHYHQVCRRFRMIDRDAERDVTAAVVAGDCESFVAERAH